MIARREVTACAHMYMYLSLTASHPIRQPAICTGHVYARRFTSLLIFPRLYRATARAPHFGVVSAAHVLYTMSIHLSSTARTPLLPLAGCARASTRRSSSTQTCGICRGACPRACIHGEGVTSHVRCEITGVKSRRDSGITVFNHACVKSPRHPLRNASRANHGRFT